MAAIQAAHSHVNINKLADILIKVSAGYCKQYLSQSAPHTPHSRHV